MSFDAVDDLHAAEDEIGRLRNLLDRIHAAMCYPFQWNADTHDAVAAVLGGEGYRFPDEDDDVNDIDDPPAETFKPWRPTGHCWRLTCQPGEADTCGCPCHNEEDE